MKAIFTILAILIIIFAIINFKPKKSKKIMNYSRNDKFENSLYIAEEIINYEYHFFGNYFNNSQVMDFIKNTNYKDRFKYVINCCNKENPSECELFLLALAYNRLGSLYNDITIHYINTYLSSKNFYDKPLKYTTNDKDILGYQINLFYSILAMKYDENLEYDKALSCAMTSLSIPSEKRYFQPYSLIAQIYYHKNNIDEAIKYLTDGINDKNLKYKEDLKKMINNYKEFEVLGKKYVSKNIKRPRYNLQETYLYDLTTGEILEE